MINRIMLPALVLVLLALAAGCASTVEVKDFQVLQAQVQRNSRDIAKLAKEIEKSRRPQAEMGADLDSLRRELAQIRGQVEETSYRMGQVPGAAAKMAQQSTQEQEAMAQRLARMEAYLGMKPGSAAPTRPAPAKAARTKAKPKPKAAPQPARPKTAAQVYDLGHRLYKKKSYKAARDRFLGLIKKYPKSKLVASARYWVGNTYFEQKKYEEAILAYNQVIKRHARSSKRPSALLKQGMAFARLGDKRTAKIVLKKLVRDYPKTKQAVNGKRILKKLK